MSTSTLTRRRTTRDGSVTTVGKAMSAALTAAGSYAGRAGATAVLWWAYTSTTRHPDE